MPTPRQPRNWTPGSTVITLTSLALGVAIFDWLGSWLLYGSLLWEDRRLGCPPSRLLVILVALPPVIVLCGSLALTAAHRAPQTGFRRLYMVTSTIFWVLLPIGIVMAWGALSTFGRRTGLC